MDIRIIVVDRTADDKDKHGEDKFAHSLLSLQKTKEYKAGIRKIGKALDRLSEKMPEELDELLNDFVQCEIDFQKFLKKECFKAGVMFGTLGKNMTDVD